MKKVFFFTIFGASLLLASCGIDSKLDAYEKACNSGEWEKTAEIILDLNAQKKDMTGKQKIRFAKISAKCADKHLGSASEEKE